MSHRDLDVLRSNLAVVEKNIESFNAEASVFRHRIAGAGDEIHPDLLDLQRIDAGQLPCST